MAMIYTVSLELRSLDILDSNLLPELAIGPLLIYSGLQEPGLVKQKHTFFFNENRLFAF